MIALKVIRLNDRAILPNYAHIGDAGLDLYSSENLLIKPNQSSLVRTGIAIELPINTEAQIRPRSGLSLKHQITVLNTPGTIDYGYRGEIGVILINHGKEAFNIKCGERIAQIVVKPVYEVYIEEVDHLSESERDIRGFGSTG
jgi:dUTP diphosphatase